jgi:hypothetical protein
MKIKMNLDELNRALKATTPVIEDKTIQDDMRNIILWVKNGFVSFVACTLYVTCESKVQAEIEFADNEDSNGEYFIRVKAKELENHLSGFNSLRMTVVESVIFDVREKELRLIVNEVASKNVEESVASRYTQTTQFRLTKADALEGTKREMKNALASVTPNTQFKAIPKADLGLYLDALIPLIPKEARDSIHTRLTFGEDFVYTVPQTYAAMMENKLPDEMKNLILTNNTAIIMQQFCSLEDTTEVAKFNLGVAADAPANTVSGIQLILRNSQSTAVLKGYGMMKAFKIDNYTSIPDVGVAFDRNYFSDVMKRFKTDITININVDNATCVIANESMTQAIPVIKSKGSGEFAFTIKPDMLTNIVFSHATAACDNFIFMYLTQENNKISVTCHDGSKLWRTKANGLTLVKNDYKW